MGEDVDLEILLQPAEVIVRIGVLVNEERSVFMLVV